MVEPLVIPFVVVVRDELAAGATPRALADQDQALEAGVLDGAHEARRVGVKVRRAGGASDGGDIGRGERVAPGPPWRAVQGTWRQRRPSVMPCAPATRSRCGLRHVASGARRSCSRCSRPPTCLGAQLH